MDDVVEVFFVADDSVVAFGFPENSFAFEMVVDFVGDELLHAAEQVFEFVIVEWLHHGVDVVAHDGVATCETAVVLEVE